MDNERGPSEDGSLYREVRFHDTSKRMLTDFL